MTLETVILVRHGETEWNVEGRRQGQLDSPLTERGFAQARALAEHVAGLPVDAIFASPLGRAAATAAVCAERIGIEATTVDELTEMDHGKMAGLTTSDIDLRFPGELHRRADDKYQWRFPDGESYADVDERAVAALAQIAAADASCPLIVSHEMVGRMLLRHLLQGDVVTALKWNQPNEALIRVNARSRTSAVIRVEL